MALTIIDRAMQSFGAEGLSQDTELARRWAGLRTLRLADVRTLCLMAACDSDLYDSGTRCCSHTASWTKRTQTCARFGQKGTRAPEEGGGNVAKVRPQSASMNVYYINMSVK